MRFIICLLLMAGCAQVTSLNMQKHQFGIQPTKIIWLQIAGLEEEQLSMLRFQYSGGQRTAFENNTCIGKSWAYNFYELRPRAEGSFLSQITGKKNIKLNCEDAQHRPIWAFLRTNGYVTGVLENGASADQGLLKLNQCGEQGLLFLSGLNYWKREQPPKGTQTYHHAEEIPLRENQIFYNRTCGASGCFSSLIEDMSAIYSRIDRVAGKHLLIVRDFTYLAALEKKNFKLAREILMDIERVYAEALERSHNSNDHLVLLTTAESRLLDMPDQGKGWFDFERKQENVSLKRTKLTNLVLASGVRAENFCGLYDDNQIFERILSGPRQQGLELKIINPFR
jgi:hypothetical protein